MKLVTEYQQNTAIKKFLEDFAPELIDDKEIHKIIKKFVNDFSAEKRRYQKKLSGSKFIKINDVWYESGVTYVDDESNYFKIKRVPGKLNLK